MESTHVNAFAHPKRNANALGVAAGMHVADFGAGSGAYSLELARLVGESGVVYAVDIQRDLLMRVKSEAHRTHRTNVHIMWADLERPKATKLRDQSLDLVLVSNLLFQTDAPHAVLAEAARILKPASCIAIIDWSASFGGLGPTKKHVVPKARSLELARDLGFKLEREFEAGAHHYGLVFKNTALPVAQ